MTSHLQADDTGDLLGPSADGERYFLHSPTAMPSAGAFLWNRRMMIQLTCRGYATAQFMQPEPAKYAHAPNLEARTFMQPEQPYYAHHPGRFFYLKDEDNGWEQTPRVRYCLLDLEGGDHVNLAADEFPPPGLAYTKYYLDGCSRTLGTEAPARLYSNCIALPRRPLAILSTAPSLGGGRFVSATSTSPLGSV